LSAPAVWNGAAAVAGGAALGALCRWGAGLWLNARWQGFPLGTLFVNLLGGLLIGVALVWLEVRPHDTWRLFVTTGVLGGFTTFSAFSLETALMIERRTYFAAAGYSLISVVLSVSALFAGLLVMRRLFA